MTGPARRLLFAGTPEFAVPSLRALLASRHELVAVLTQPDRPAGRGRRARPSPVKLLARAHGIAVHQPASLQSPVVQAELAGLDIDLMVVVAYGLLLPRAVLEIPARGCVNIQAALLAGDARTGVCLMQLEAGLDTGPVYARAELPIGARDTASDLHDRLADLGARLLAEHLDAILAGELVAEPQPETGVTYAHRINKADARLDWSRSAVDLDRQVRAYFGWPVADTSLAGQQLRIWGAERAAVEARGAPGEVIGVDGSGVLVQTGDGVLRLLEVQAAGRARTAAVDFARGRDLVGQRLGR
jgi:methionyl-tRNA formyltransferase